jgi:NADH-quinone oxidoreductase subunit J
MTTYAFFIVAILMGVGALRLVTTKNVVHGALYLVVTLGGAAVMFLLLLAEFVAWVQILIYVGAVVVLLLFGLMLTRAPIGRTALDNQQRPLAALVAAGIFVVTSTVLWRAFEGRKIPVGSLGSIFGTQQLGAVLFTKFILPFEIASVLLLAALVGAVILAKKD